MRSDQDDLTSGGLISRFFRDTNQTIANGSFTSFQATRERINRGEVGLQGSSFSIRRSGLYYIAFNIMFVANASGNRIAQLQRTSNLGAGMAIASDYRAAAPNNETVVHASTMALLEAGDSLAVVLFHTSGGNLDVIGNANANNNHTAEVTFVRL